MVKVIDSQITETFHTLVNPQDYFSQQNIKVHGIQPEDVENAPTFDYVFPYILCNLLQIYLLSHITRDSR